jgi:multidrug efflux pump subunit AcrA (membrane-fusion protein)
MHRKLKLPSVALFLGICGVLILIVINIIKNQLQEVAFVSVVEKGNIRDSVSGNVKVLPALSFQLISNAQSKIEFAALIPMGKPIQVEANETIFSMNTEDLDRHLKRTLLSQQSHEKRLATGSSVELQLELEEKNLQAYMKLSQENSKDVSKFELETKTNLVERLRRQFEFEKISNQETSETLRLELDRIKKELSERIISSPINGTLISSNVKKGDTILGGQLLGQVQSEERIIEVTLNEEDFAGIKEDQKVGVSLFSFGRQVFEGKVSRVSATINPQSGRRKLFVELDTNQTLPVGASGRAEIIKEEKVGVLVIPRKALLGNSVLTVRDGKAVLVKVEVGAKNLEFIEIKQGLALNEKVISETPHLFYDGEHVSSTVLE